MASKRCLDSKNAPPSKKAKTDALCFESSMKRLHALGQKKKAAIAELKKRHKREMDKLGKSFDDQADVMKTELRTTFKDKQFGEFCSECLLSSFPLWENILFY